MLVSVEKVLQTLGEPGTLFARENGRKRLVWLSKGFGPRNCFLSWSLNPESLDPAVPSSFCSGKTNGPLRRFLKTGHSVAAKDWEIKSQPFGPGRRMGQKGKPKGQIFGQGWRMDKESKFRPNRPSKATGRHHWGRDPSGNCLQPFPKCLPQISISNGNLKGTAPFCQIFSCVLRMIPILLRNPHSQVDLETWKPSPKGVGNPPHAPRPWKTMPWRGTMQPVAVAPRSSPPAARAWSSRCGRPPRHREISPAVASSRARVVGVGNGTAKACEKTIKKNTTTLEGRPQARVSSGFVHGQTKNWQPLSLKKQTAWDRVGIRTLQKVLKKQGPQSRKGGFQ